MYVLPVVAAVIPAGVAGDGGIGLLAPGQVPSTPCWLNVSPASMFVSDARNDFPNLFTVYTVRWVRCTNNTCHGEVGSACYHLVLDGGIASIGVVAR